MKTSFKIGCILLMVFSISTCLAQEEVKPYTAKAYWNELNRSDYRTLKEKALGGMEISGQEQKWLDQFEKYLAEYYEGLAEEEKAKFLQHKDEWYLASGLTELAPESKAAPRRDPDLLLKHIAFSGISGLSYGLMLNGIFDYGDQANIAVPTILSGVSMLYPVFSKEYDNINNNTLWLRTHGKIAGGLYGYMLGLTIWGDNLDDEYIYDETTGDQTVIEGHMPGALTLSLSASLGLGYLGFYLGKNQNWTEGRASMYQYYGYAIPALTASIVFATGESRARAYGINHLLSAPLGYLLANQVSKNNDYTRGDVSGIIGLTGIGTTYGLGFLILVQGDSQSSILLPSLMGATGSLIGHAVYKDFHLSRPEGRRVNYAAIGGGLIGVGITALINPEGDGALYALIPASTGLLGYSLLAGYYKKNKRDEMSINTNNKPLLNVQLYPENLIFSRMDTHGYIPPLVSASLQF
jgi:hypothetical protein